MTATATRPTPSEIDAKASIILVACCVIWGLGLVMVKLANAGIPPFLNSALRSIAGGAILFFWARARGVSLFTRDGTLVAGLVSGLVFAIEFLALYQGLTLTQAARATVFLHCAPFIAALGEHFFIPGYRLTRTRALGLLAAFAGLAIALGFGVNGTTQATITGDLLCLLAGIAWGAVTVVVRGSRLRNVAAEKTLLYQLAVSAPVLLAASWLFGERGITDLSPAVLGAFAYTVLAVVVIGYTTWFWLMRTYSAASLHAFTFLTPIFGALAGHLVLGEAIGTPVLIGLTLVASGIWLVNRPAAA